MALLGLFFPFCGTVSADPVCFSLAKNYYEQVYCELQSLGRDDALPAFSDFRSNDEITQALLLKRPAKRVGIDVPLPKRHHSEAIETRQTNQSSEHMAKKEVSHLYSGGGLPAVQGCRIEGRSLYCGGRKFDLVDNRSNQKLPVDALSNVNRMSLPVYEGSHQDSSYAEEYVYAAYSQYARKMMEIGLGGSTMMFAKFRYFFEESTDSSVNFAARFERIFSYLKKDKKILSVPSIVFPLQLNVEQCGSVESDLIACVSGSRNFLFEAN
ncbi:MAG: hypothetical protein ACWA5K_04530 [bacterium]